MSDTRLYVEGGGPSKEMQIRCRAGFRSLIEKMNLGRRLPRIVACGGRQQAFDHFVTATDASNGAYVALLVDSEDTVEDLERPWEHLRQRVGDGWIPPDGTTDDQVLLMVTCMETWLLADPEAIRAICGPGMIDKHLPTFELENRDRKEQVFDKLIAATKHCKKTYDKGDLSFAILARVNPMKLITLKSFERTQRILEARL